MSSHPQRPVRDIKPAPSQAHAHPQAGSLSLKVLVSVLSVLVLVVSGVGYTFVGRVGGDLASVSDLALGGGNHGFKDGSYSDGALDILVVGSDSRTDAQGNTLSDSELAALHAGVDGGEDNTDTIMVIRIPEDGSRATAISIPRDTYVNAGNDYGNMKINGVFAAHANTVRTQMVQENDNAVVAGQSAPYSDKDIDKAATSAGRKALLAQVKDLTGIEIDHYAEVGLVGFVLLTDAVGGVDVCLNAPVNEELSGANFPAGRQTLNGAQGLAFVRQRHDLPRGDLDRIVRQQSYAASLVNKILSSGTLTNPSKLNEISKAIERSVVIDENWDLMSLITQLSGLAGGNVEFTTIPVTSIDGVGDYGESIVTVDKSQVHRFFEDLANTSGQTPTTANSAATSPTATSVNPDLKPVADGLEVHVLNAGTVSGLASQISGWLQGVGYTVADTSNAEPGLYSGSQIVASDPNDQRAHDLATQLGGLPVTGNSTLDANTFIVVAGDDYAGPARADQATAPAQQTTPTDALVGTPGEDFNTTLQAAPAIDAGGDGPHCVN